MNNRQIGERIAELRKKHNLSQQDLANKLNVSNKTISKWECGNGTPDIDSLNKISKIFSITLDAIVNNRELEENQKEKKKAFYRSKKFIALIVSCSIAFITLISLLCYFCIPRKPQILNSNIFVVNQKTSTLSCIVDNDKTLFSFNNSITLSSKNTWKLYYDLDCNYEIVSKTVNLQEGDNKFYIIVENDSNDKKVYSVIIRRKPMYTVCFDTDGGSFIENKFIMEGCYLDSIIPVKEGYVFSSWDYDFSKPITSNITIKASWIACEYNIIYYANNDTEDFEIQNVTYNTNIAIKNNRTFSRTGYTLTSWNTQADGLGTYYTPSQVIWAYKSTRDLNLYAQWSINQYSVSLTKNLNDAGSVSGSGVFDYGAQYTLTSSTNEGYRWLGWYNQSGELLSESTTFIATMIDENVNIKACWAIQEYSVIYYANNGTDEYEIQSVIYKTNLVIKENQNFSKTGYSFIGWNTKQDGSGISYSPQQSISPYTSTSDMFLYAQWIINQYGVSVTNNLENAGSVSGEGFFDYGSPYTLTVSTNLGYEWLGWYNQDDELLTIDAIYNATMTANNINIKAKWDEKDEMKIYDFSSSDTNCGINKLKDSINKSQVTTLIIPNYVNYISIEDFYSCTNIESIVVEDGNIKYESLGGNCLIDKDNDTLLIGCKNTIIPNNVKSIANKAFFNCIALESIHIPSRVTSIGDSVFTNCSSLSTITVDINNTKYESLNGNCIIEKSTNTLLIGCKGTIIPNTVKIIGSKAFNNCSSLTSITVPNNVIKIETGAFSGCSKLNNISLPFTGNNADRTSYIFLGAIFGATSWEGQYVYIPESLKTVTITGGSKIDNYSFQDCISIESINILTNATSIGDKAFYNCTSLENIKLPNSINTINSSAFNNCTSLKNIVLPNYLSSIGWFSFANCTSLESIDIPNTTTSISENAFISCSSLKSISIPFVGEKADGTGKTNFGIIFGDSYIDYYGTNVPSSLKKVTITNCAKISSNAFKNCSLIEEIILPENLLNIGSKAFENCSSLKSIIIPESVTSIGESAFYACGSLDEIEFKNENNWYYNNQLIDNSILSNKTQLANFIRNNYTYTWINKEDN